MQSSLALVSSQPNPQGDGDDLYPQTAESIASARAAQLLERRAAMADVPGLVITDEGTIYVEVLEQVLKATAFACHAIYGGKR